MKVRLTNIIFFASSCGHDFLTKVYKSCSQIVHYHNGFQVGALLHMLSAQ